MVLTKLSLRPEKFDDEAAIEKLNAEAFGPARYTKAAHYLRRQGADKHGSGHDSNLSVVAELNSQIIGSVRMTPLKIGVRKVLLLGPIVVDGNFRKLAIGSQLMNQAIENAKKTEFRVIILVGDANYYHRFGFKKIPEGRVILPLPYNPERLLAHDLGCNSVDELCGPIHHLGITL